MLALRFGDGFCASEASESPVCATIGQNTGSCVACISDAQCQGDAPICDSSNSCQACNLHSQCSEKTGTSCDFWSGACMEGSVWHVDNSISTSGDGSSKESAFQSLSEAMTAIAGDGNTGTIMVYGGGTTYQESLSITSGNIVLIGIDNPVLQGTGGNAISVQQSDSALSITWNQSGRRVWPRSVTRISPDFPCLLLAM